MPKAPLPLIQDGVARGGGARHAQRRAGGDRVHRATRSSRAAAARARGRLNLVLVGGGAADVEELCAPIERGVYVTRFWYENVVRPKETLVTAVTRDGTFLIEDGRITRPLRDLRLTDTRAGRSSRACEDLTAAPAADERGRVLRARALRDGVVAPALRASAMRFTGATG